ncbi:MAG: hypothetical protein R3B09_10100 [Nannocystaceae bacterium]
MATTNPSASLQSARRQALLYVVLLFVVPWGVYLVLLGRQPDEPFSRWHGEVVWPAAHYLVHSQGGILLPILAQVFFGGIGGLLVGTMVAGLCRLLARVRVPDVGGPLSAAIFCVAPLWAFVAFKAVPERVTVIDREARTLEVRAFQLFLRYPEGVTTIAGDEVRALELTSHFVRRAGDRFLRLHALVGDAWIELAERTCDSGDAAACLAEGDDDLIRLAAWLGRPGAGIDANPERHRLILGRAPADAPVGP